MGKKVVKDKRFHSKLVNLVILFHYYSGKIHYNKGQDGVIASEYIDRFVLRYFMLRNAFRAVSSLATKSACVEKRPIIVKKIQDLKNFKLIYLKNDKTKNWFRFLR